MKNNYKRAHRFIAYGLILSLSLQSCGPFSNQPVPGLYKVKGEVRSITQRKGIASLVDQEFTAEKGYLITFHKQEENLQADVKIDASQEGPNYTNVPVVLANDVRLSELSHLDQTIQQRCIQVERTLTGIPSRIVVLRGGLRGGMMEGDTKTMTCPEKSLQVNN